MRVSWQKKDNNKSVIIFFSGWGINPSFFECWDTDLEYDICFLYAYDKDLDQNIDSLCESYSKRVLIAWSFGAVMAEKYLSNSNLEFCAKIIFNGSLLPVHDEYGIPKLVFQKTIEYLDERNYLKFLYRTFGGLKKFKAEDIQYNSNSIESLIKELRFLGDLSNRCDCLFHNWTKVFVGDNDLIIPATSQLNFWEDYMQISIEKMEDVGHYPFVGIKSWKELIYKIGI
ncbi:MAG: pimeloyl-ACP methyl esterase BioG family protein [Bacteroidales bacterium]